MLMLRYEIAMGASKKAKRVDGIAGASTCTPARTRKLLPFIQIHREGGSGRGGQRALFRCMKDKVHEPLQSR